MRFQVLTTVLASVLLGAVLFATACTGLPAASLVKLSQVDFQTTDLSHLRAAVLLPDYLRPHPEGAWLQIAVSAQDGSTLEQKLRLTAVDDPEAATINAENSGGRQIYAFELSSKGLRDLEQLRHEAIRAQQSGAKRRLTVSIAADACSTAAVPAGPVRVTTYLKTAETKSFVPLVRNADLRTAMPGGTFELKRCPR